MCRFSNYNLVSILFLKNSKKGIYGKRLETYLLITFLPIDVNMSLGNNMEWDKSLIHGPTPIYISSTNFPSCWLLYVSNPSFHRYNNIQHMFSPRALNLQLLHCICQTQRGQVCRMKALNLLHGRDSPKVLFRDLLWLQVKQAALSFLHLVHGSIHPEGNAFVISLAHDEADVPAVKQSSTAAPLQVHCDGKSTTLLPLHPATTRSTLTVSEKRKLLFLPSTLAPSLGLEKPSPLTFILRRMPPSLVSFSALKSSSSICFVVNVDLDVVRHSYIKQDKTQGSV